MRRSTGLVHVRSRLFIAFLLLVVVALPSLAATAKKSFTKATVARSSFKASASPERPADTLLDGLDGRVLEDYEDITLVEINESDKDQLEQRGEEQSVLVTIRDDFDKIFLNGKVIDSRDDKKVPPPGEKHDPPYQKNEQGAWLVQFVGPIKTEWLETLKAEGIVPVQYVAMNAYLVGARESAIQRIENLHFVQFTLQLHRFLRPSVGDSAASSIEVWIELAETDETDDAVELFGKMSKGELDVAQWSDSERRVQGVFDTTDIDTILAHPLVIGIAPRPTIGLSDERAAFGVTNIVPTVGSPSPEAGKYKKWLSDLCHACTNLQGDGFYIGIADTGLDGGDRVASGTLSGEQGSTNLHRSELAGSRIAWGASFEADTGDWSGCGVGGPCPDSTNSKHDVVGHGTLVAGIAAGNPSTSDAKDADGYFWGLGVAPSAGLAITKIDSLKLGNGAMAVQTLTRDARSVISPNAYWQNFSLNQYYPAFGSPTCSNLYDGGYSVLSREFDAAVRDANSILSGNQSITLTTSSGNIDQNLPSTGWSEAPGACAGLDRTLTLPPATAKNVLAVGGGENVRPDPWLCHRSRADDYANLAINAKRGTKYSGYFKPDLIAVSSSIASMRSNDLYDPSGSLSYCDPLSGTEPSVPSEYFSSSGTSFAAPIGAAAVALASRRFSADPKTGCADPDPGCAKPALVKAMLIAGAKSMRGGLDRATLQTWKKSGPNYYVGNRVLPTSPNGHYYEVESVGSAGYGQTGANEPTWPTNATTVIDEQAPNWPTRITWRDKGLETASPSLQIGAFPNNKQGFGRISLTDVLSDYPMRYFDNEVAAHVLTSGGSWTREFMVHDMALPVRIALVWTDPPAMWNQATTPLDPNPPLVNNLNLSVEVRQSGNCVGRYVGNVLEPTEESTYFQPCTGGTPDIANNAEIVRFSASSSRGDTTFTVKIAFASGTSTQDFGLVVWNAYDSGTTTPPPPTPSNFAAVGSSTTEVSLTWTASSGAASYDVERSAGVSDPFVAIGTPTTNSFTDTGRSPLTSYLYRVRARNSTGVSDWAVDPGTTLVFTDPVLTAGLTIVKKNHFTELRQAVASMRTAAGLGTFTWTDDPLVVETTLIKAIHVEHLRTALQEARIALGLLPVSFTDGTLTPGASVVKATHIQELRDGL